MVTAFKPVAQNLGQADSLDEFLSVFRRLNQFIQEGLIFHKSNGDYNNALVQLEVYAFLNDVSRKLITNQSEGRGNQDDWSLLEELIVAVETGTPTDVRLMNSLRHKYAEWRKVVSTEVWSRTTGYKSTSVLVKSPIKRSCSVDDSIPIKKQNIAEDSLPNDDEVIPATDSPESTSTQSPSKCDESKIVVSSIFEIEITKEDNMRVGQLLQGAISQVIVKKFNLEMRRSDIRTLFGSNWLNDNVINFYMELLNERSEQNVVQLPSVHAMNSYFLQRLKEKGYWAVRRWTRKIDLFSKQIIAVPVHFNGHPAHWSMAIIDMRDKTMRYYDSMGLSNKTVLVTLKKYLQRESLDKRQQAFNTSDFKVEDVKNVPRQLNGDDCGVFCCMFAEYLTRDAPLTFTQNNMVLFRKKMILEIAEGKLRT